MRKMGIKLRDYDMVSYMNTRATPTPMFEDGPTVVNLFRTILSVIREWIRIRVQGYRYKKLDFRQLRHEEIPSDLRAIIDADRNAPDEDFENL